VPKKQRRPKEEDEEIASDDEEYNSDLGGDGNTLAFSSDEGEEETPQDKRLRLAKQYLSEIEKQEAERAEDRELAQSVEQRLQTEYLDSVGKLRRNIAGSLKACESSRILKHKLHHTPICALALSPDMDGDQPHEIGFQPGQRVIFIDHNINDLFQKLVSSGIIGGATAAPTLQGAHHSQPGAGDV